MKKIFTLLNAVVLLSLCALFTACERDEDVEESMVLSGSWQGNWGMYYEYQYRDGYVRRFDSYDTDIEFTPDYRYATHGYGYQVDWYREGPYERLSYRFNWSIHNGVIHITYPANHHYDVDIYDYYLSNNYFSGSFSSGGDAFRLRKLSDFYWDDYYGYDYYEWGWTTWDAKTRGNKANNGDEAGEADGQIIKIGSSLAEQEANK